MHNDAKAGYREIAKTLNITNKEVKAIISRVSRFVEKPSILDNEDALVNAYIRVYRSDGVEAARREVARRIAAGREIRKLRQMRLEKEEQPDDPKTHLPKHRHDHQRHIRANRKTVNYTNK
jgi:hypothetical protein